MTERTITEKFGRVLRAARREQGLSQERLAEKTGIDRTYVSMIERHKRKPTLDIAERLAVALEMKLSEMIERAEKLED